MSFIDEIKIYVIGGDGGNGNLGYIKKGDKKIHYGGRGGKGGDIYLQADHNITNFNRIKLNNIFKAQNGSHGDKNGRKGKKGDNLLIKVPIWTKIYCLKTKYMIATLSFNKEKRLIAKGGNYGLGSKSFKRGNPFNKGRKYFIGEPGESFELLLKVILKNDITIIGLPNVGKSTLFNRLTNNFSKIDNYPYTTDIPYLGIFYKDTGEKIEILDLPNMININNFEINNLYLKHLQYSKLILFLLDINTYNENLMKIYICLEQIKLSINQQKCSIWLIFNKMDLIKNISYRREEIINIIKRISFIERYYFISAHSDKDLDILLCDIRSYI